MLFYLTMSVVTLVRWPGNKCQIITQRKILTTDLIHTPQTRVSTSNCLTGWFIPAEQSSIELTTPKSHQPRCKPIARHQRGHNDRTRWERSTSRFDRWSLVYRAIGRTTAQPRAGGAGARSRDASIVDKHGGDSIELAAAASLLTTTHAHSYECLALLNKPDLIIYSNLPD